MSRPASFFPYSLFGLSAESVKRILSVARIKDGKSLVKPFLEACNTLQINYIIIMKEVRFEWNNKKDLTNFQNHGVTFDEAKKSILRE